MSVESVGTLAAEMEFGGISQLKKLRDQGLDVVASDSAVGLRDTWYWTTSLEPHMACCVM
jgi:hypothetical protein